MTREMLIEVGITLAVPMLQLVDNEAAVSQIAGEAPLLKAKNGNVSTKFLV